MRSLIVLGAAFLAWGLEAADNLTGVRRFEEYLLDRRHFLTNESFQGELGERDSEITLVLFNENSIFDPDEGWAYLSPFPREYLAKLIDVLAKH